MIRWAWLRYCGVVVFVPQVLEKRLRDRGTEDEESLATRLHNAREEIDYGNAQVWQMTDDTRRR